MVAVNEKRLIQTSVAALLVIAGVVLKNSAEQLKQSKNSPQSLIGILLFVFGWAAVAYTTSIGRSNKIPFVLSSVAIVIAVMQMKQFMASGKAIPKIYPVVFALAWVALGVSVGQHLNTKGQVVSLLIPAFVLLSMMVSLPAQRAKCVVDGPGFALFTAGWALLIYLNAKDR
tara:strand:- start:613 stop:1128 length:516 start_codon:yes stop_codon:yes gene_type:complete